MKKERFYSGLIILAVVLAAGGVYSATSVRAVDFQAADVDRGTFPVMAADDHGGKIPDPTGPKYPGKIGRGLGSSAGGVGSVSTRVGGSQPYDVQDHRKKGPALKSTDMKECAKSVQVHVKLDLSGLNPQEVSPVEGEKTVTLPLVGSAPFLNKAVQCRYASGKVSMSYLLNCIEPTKSGVPNAYSCKKIHLLLQTPPVPAPPIQR